MGSLVLNAFHWAPGVGITPLEIMVENTRYYWRKRRDPQCRVLAQECAKDAAPYIDLPPEKWTPCYAAFASACSGVM